MMSRIDSRHWKISTGHYFQNGRHNTPNIQHCSISSKFDMWVDNDVPKWFLTSKNFYRSPFSKWPPQYCTNSTLFDFNVLNWFLTLKNFYRLPNQPQTTGLKNKLQATFEIEQCWIFSVLWRPFWKWRPVEIVQCRESIQDVEIKQCWICAVLLWSFWKWRLVEIFQCQESIQDVEIEQCWICAVLWWSFWKWKWSPQYRKNSTLFDFKGSL
jgi:hypothetical protein